MNLVLLVSLLLTSSMKQICCWQSGCDFPQAAFASSLSAQGGNSVVDGYEARTFRSRDGKTMLYRLFIPRNYDSKKRYPIVLWLHGGGGRGSDNIKQISEGNRTGTRLWVSPDAQEQYPAFVLAPQCPDGQMWTTVADASSLPPLKLALELLAAIEKEFLIDPQRRYVAGQSMGGLGSWSLITEHPDMFAAAIPVCGGGNEALASRLTHTAIWAFHGAQDQAISADRSRRMIAGIRKAGGKPRYTEYSDLGHNSWDRAFQEPGLLDWVFAQKSLIKK